MQKQILIETVAEILDNECYDMAEELQVKDIQNFVCDLVNRMKRTSVPCLRIKVGKEWKYTVKVSDTPTGSFLSINGEDGTGVSRSLSYIFQNKQEPDEDGIKSLLDMLNEAWYLYQNI